MTSRGIRIEKPINERKPSSQAASSSPLSPAFTGMLVSAYLFAGLSFFIISVAR